MLDEISERYYWHIIIGSLTETVLLYKCMSQLVPSTLAPSTSGMLKEILKAIKVAIHVHWYILSIGCLTETELLSVAVIE